MTGFAGIVPLLDGNLDRLLELESLIRVGLSSRGSVDFLPRSPTSGVSTCFDGQLHDRTTLSTSLTQTHRDDSALITSAYTRWGDDFVDKIVGDFAVAILDCEQQLLVLATDFIGSRPLAYAITRDFVCFASEPAALAALPGIDDRPDEFALVLSLMGEVGSGVHTHYRGVSWLQGGHLLKVGLNDGLAQSPSLVDAETAGSRFANGRRVRGRIPRPADGDCVGVACHKTARSEPIFQVASIPLP